jgi:hypothetical protein
MQTLKDVARYVRSKNAGPFWVTIDIFCDSIEAFECVRSAPSLAAEQIAGIYNIDAANIRRFEVEQLKVLKISFPRPVAQGSVRDTDSHAGQYFVPLLTLPMTS